MHDDALPLQSYIDKPAAAGWRGGSTADDAGEAKYLSSFSKRVMDLTGASLLLLVLMPLLLLAALLVTMTTRGGALYLQQRYGRDRAIFRVFKLRSMRVEGDVPFRQAVRNDPRVTWIGRIIRKTSIDEFPQLLNVLKGEMSLVGPRPHAVEHDDQFAFRIADYGMRYMARPGMTGLAQVNGARGATPTDEHMRRRLDLDLRYIREASFVLDCKILTLTIRELLSSPKNDAVF